MSFSVPVRPGLADKAASSFQSYPSGWVAAGRRLLYDRPRIPPVLGITDSISAGKLHVHRPIYLPGVGRTDDLTTIRTMPPVDRDEVMIRPAFFAMPRETEQVHSGRPPTVGISGMVDSGHGPH